eukprot:scaffold9519_cov183-Amphora_coffeaeformis.AAC.12
MKNLNLRHLDEVSASDLSYLPCQINSLWIGPGFGSSACDVVQNLPVGLQQLDLDLTAETMSTPGMEIHEEHLLMHLLFQRVVSLESLSLRIHGCAGARAVAKNLSKAKKLKTLDFRKNYIGDIGLQLLCRAMLTWENHVQLQRLILSWNNITDVGVYALCQVLKSPRCQLKSLDLSCNGGISDAGFAAICKALRTNKTLERLTLFACSGITNAILLKELLVEGDAESLAASSGTMLYNYTLKYVDLGATKVRAMEEVMEQIKFGLALNRAGRLQLRCEQDDFLWILKSNLEDDAMMDDDGTATAKAASSFQWWRPAHETVQKEEPLEDLSISFYLLRQTSAFWSKLAPSEIYDGDAMICD